MELRAISLLGTCGHVDETDKMKMLVVQERFYLRIPRLIAETFAMTCRLFVKVATSNALSRGLWGNKFIPKFINLFVSFNLCLTS